MIRLSDLLRAETQRAERLEALLREARPYLTTANAFKQDDAEPDLCQRIDAALGEKP